MNIVKKEVSRGSLLFHCSLESLLLQFVLLQYILVSIRLIHAQIGEQFAALGYFAKQSAACRVIFLVVLQVIRQESDGLGEDRDLHLRGACILCMRTMLGDKSFLCGLLDSHRDGEQVKRFLPRLLRVNLVGARTGSLFYESPPKKQDGQLKNGLPLRFLYGGVYRNTPYFPAGSIDFA